jgi:hypothetical protein
MRNAEMIRLRAFVSFVPFVVIQRSDVMAA